VSHHFAGQCDLLIRLNLYNRCSSCRDDHIANPVTCPRLWQLQLRPIAVTIASCKHPVRGPRKPPAANVLHIFLRERSHVSTNHVDASYFYVSLIYGEYRYLANVHFCNIMHTFIPHFILHSAEKICIEFSADYTLTSFRILRSAKYPFPAQLANKIGKALGCHLMQTSKER